MSYDLIGSCFADAVLESRRTQASRNDTDKDVRWTYLGVEGVTHVGSGSGVRDRVRVDSTRRTHGQHLSGMTRSTPLVITAHHFLKKKIGVIRVILRRVHLATCTCVRSLQYSSQDLYGDSQ